MENIRNPSPAGVKGSSPSDRVTDTYRPTRTSANRDNGYAALIDAMAELRQQGIEVPPAVEDLIVQLYAQKKAAEDRLDHVASRHVRLQGEHTQLVTAFNSFCRDSDNNNKNNNSSWQARARESLFEDIYRSFDSANALAQLWRDTLSRMFTEYMGLNNEAARLRREAAELRRENEALREELEKAKER
ncbi:hypothetical protein F4779DRAFT_362316 [Xylariaceae sp. FL0662B]|nr:hypothetical protein F4779DRAFT_362316 [Xylariaceae sp. FL0662B]